MQLRPALLLPIFAWISLANVEFSLAYDWPQWNGPTRDGRISDLEFSTNLDLTKVKELWQTPISHGYSGPAVIGQQVVVTDLQIESGKITNNPGGRDKLSGRERVLCLDRSTGKLIWKHDYAVDYLVSYGAGPRATPTIANNRIYTLGAEGHLICFDAPSGTILWQRNLRDDYKTETPMWGYASPPLVIGDQLIVLAGGKGSTYVSLNTDSGVEQWRSGSASNIGYSPPMWIEVDGSRQLIVWDADALRSLELKTGKELWSTPLSPRFEMSIMAPVVSGNRLYASGIGQVSGLFELLRDAQGVKTLWTGKPKMSVYCSNSTPVFDGKYLYGCDCDAGTLMCVDSDNGARLWETSKPITDSERPARHGTIFLSKAKDGYSIFSENGDLIMADLTPEGYREKSRIKLIEPTNECFGRKVVWAYPAYSKNQIFVRNDKVMKCFSLR